MCWADQDHRAPWWDQPTPQAHAHDAAHTAHQYARASGGFQAMVSGLAGFDLREISLDAPSEGLALLW
jgi:hypothetical protein